MKNKILDTKALQDPTLKEKFQECIKKEIDARILSESNDIEERTKRRDVINKALFEPVSTLRKPNNVWISQEIMQLSDAKRAVKQNQLESAGKWR